MRPSGALRDHLTGDGDAPPAEPTEEVLNIDQLLELPETRDQIEAALPPGLNINLDRYMRVLRSVPIREPELILVHPIELLNAYIGCAQLGLEPNSILEQCFLVPVPIPDSTGRAVEFIMGYKGMIALAYRSPEIESIEAHVVYKLDEFAFEQGTESYLMHSWEIDEPRGDVKGYYGIVRFPGDKRPRFWPISLEEIEEHKSFSATADDPGSLWNKRPIQMGLKTVIRIMFPMLPISAEALDAAAQDGSVIGFRTPPEPTDPDPEQQDQAA